MLDTVEGLETQVAAPGVIVGFAIVNLAGQALGVRYRSSPGSSVRSTG